MLEQLGVSPATLKRGLAQLRDCSNAPIAFDCERRGWRLDCLGRNRNEHREVSPQRLIQYRDDWCLDAWCPVKRGLRTFGIDAVKAARVLDQAAMSVRDGELDAVIGAGYGIFAGRKVQGAKLRFTPERAR